MEIFNDFLLSIKKFMKYLMANLLEFLIPRTDKQFIFFWKFMLRVNLCNFNFFGEDEMTDKY